MKVIFHKIWAYHKFYERLFYESNLSPVNLAWASYLTVDEYENICEKYSDIKDDLGLYTLTDGDYRIVAYRKILTDYEGFHRHLEEFNIYHGNKSFIEFKDIILKRFSKLDSYNNIFESSLFHYNVTTMMLFYEMRDYEIVEFYREVFDVLKDKKLMLIYIDTDDISETINVIKGERVDLHCNEVWFQPLAKYIQNSPLGIQNDYSGLDGVLEHLESRKALELRIIREVFKDNAVVIKSKNYSEDLESIVEVIMEDREKLGVFGLEQDKSIIGKYKHFKGNEYLVYGACLVGNNNEKYVLYERLVNNSFWIRPYDMYFETVEREGKTFKRFELVELLDLNIDEKFVIAQHSESLEEYKININN